MAAGGANTCYHRLGSDCTASPAHNRPNVGCLVGLAIGQTAILL